MEMLMGTTHRTADEFSDESLFGEDRIEDLIEKKNSNFQKGGGAAQQNLLIGMAESSFRSKQGGAINAALMRARGADGEMEYSQ